MSGAPPLVEGLVGLHHVAFAVAGIDDALELWIGLLGGSLELRRVLPDQRVEAASIHGIEGSPLIELVAPLERSSGGVGRFLEQRGPGMHHVAWEVADVATALETLTRAGIRAIDQVARPGLHGTLVAFLHPRSTGGVLTELVQSTP